MKNIDVICEISIYAKKHRCFYIVHHYMAAKIHICDTPNAIIPVREFWIGSDILFDS